MPNADRNAAWVHTNSGGCSSAGAPRLRGVSQSPLRTIPLASSEYIASSYPAKSPWRISPRNRMAAARASTAKRIEGCNWNTRTRLSVRPTIHLLRQWRAPAELFEPVQHHVHLRLLGRLSRGPFDHQEAAVVRRDVKFAGGLEQHLGRAGAKRRA